MSHITVEPIYENDLRVGSRVWDGDTELEETSPVFRAAVCGLTWRGGPPPVGDTDARGIVGGSAIFRRAVSTSSPAPKGDNGKAEQAAAPMARTAARDDTAVARAAARLAMLRARV